MTNPALQALQAPAQYPAAAISRLGETAAALLAESLSTRAGLYSAFLARLAAVIDRAGPLLALAIDQSASEAQLAGLANAERVLAAAAPLFDELARRTSRREQLYAMQWAKHCRTAWADLTLVRREFAATVYLGLDWVTAQPVAPVRILPGAEAALLTLALDPLTAATDWDLYALASRLALWVTVS